MLDQSDASLGCEVSNVLSKLGETLLPCAFELHDPRTAKEKK